MASSKMRQKYTKSDAERVEHPDLKVHFYQYLAENHTDSQVIIIENEHLPAEVTGQLTVTDFTKNPDEGRYGLFPISG